jgi:hypothetical protein
MRRIHYIYFRFLRAEALYQFLELFLRLLNSFPHVRNAVAPLYSRFVALLEKMKLLIDARKSSDYTQQIAAADHKDDQLIIGIRGIVNAATHHFDSAVAAAALSLQKRLKPFGDIVSKSYEEEVAAIKILLVDLLGEYAQKVDLVGIMPWVKELAIAVNEFENLLELRRQERARKPLERLREVRLEIETVYRQMIERIAAVDVLDEQNTYTDFINQLNTEIDYFNEYNHHQPAKDIKTAIVQPIHEQKYTSEAITPLPEISMDGKKLVFMQDYTLSYRNNVDAGNAEVIIHGKGAYKGSKTITFFINK